MIDPEKTRKKFPITKNKIYFAHASRAPLSLPIINAIQNYLDFFSISGKTKIDDGISGDGGKSLFAKLIGVKKDEIAFIENTSMGLNIAANMINIPKGANIVTSDFEYSSVIHPYLLKKPRPEIRFVKNRFGKVFVEDIEKMIDDSTAIIALSHVHWLSGFRYDLKTISDIGHEHGAILIIDGVQGVGAVDIDAKRIGVNVLSTSCYKWLLGPPGCGYLYIDAELLQLSQPSIVGWRSQIQVNEDEYTFPDHAEKFEVGAPSFLSFVGAAAALEMIIKIGSKKIEKRILHLTDLLIDGISDLGFNIVTPKSHDKRAGIVNFTLEHPEKFVGKLLEKGIVICGSNESWSKSSKLFINSVRVSPHFYNTEDEVIEFLLALRNYKLSS